MVCFVTCFVVMIYSANKAKQEEKEEQTVKEIKEVVVPVNITDSKEKVNYVVQHFWDEVDSKDTNYIAESATFEKAFVDYLTISNSVYVDNLAIESINLLLQKAENTAMFTHILDLYEKYLYNADSPLRNDDNYVEVLNYVIKSNTVDSLEKLRPRYKLKQMLISRVGEKAENFIFLTEDAQEKDFYSVNNDYILLCFYNEGCEVCSETKLDIQNTPTFHNPRVSVVEINTETTKDIKDKFDIRATPCLYLLDDEKVVLIKDKSVEEIEQYLLDREI